MPSIHSPFQRFPARSWRHATGRARTYAVGLALLAAAEISAMSGLPRPIALAVFTAGLAVTAAATRPARGRS